MPTRTSLSKVTLMPAAIGTGTPPMSNDKIVLTATARLPKGLAPKPAANTVAALAGVVLITPILGRHG
jgi:hypothetical protein